MHSKCNLIENEPSNIERVIVFIFIIPFKLHS